MSVESISWALNLAPVPLDPSGKPNPACAAVLIGLANHAGPDGCGAFPSTHTLVRYTRLSKRTVQTALDRLEELGVISRCRPEIIAAHIPDPRYRPQGWDLALHQIRDDLTEQDIASLERIYPGIRDRLAAKTARQAGVQPLHPSPEDDPGVQLTQPGVQLTQSRGAVVAPKPSIEPSIEPNEGSQTDPSSSSGVAALTPDSDDDDPPEEPGINDPGAREDVDRICAHLADRIEQNWGKRPNVIKAWRRAARLMLDKDGLTEAQVIAAIDWCQDDEFWAPNIRSVTKLREKYIQLRAAAIRQRQRAAATNGYKPSTTDARVNQALELAARYAAEEEAEALNGHSPAQIGSGN